MNKQNLEYYGMNFHEMQSAVVNHLRKLGKKDVYTLQEIVQELFGNDVFWDEQEQKFYRSVEWIRG